MNVFPSGGHVERPASNVTRKAMENSLKKLMLGKPLDKITIRDITDDCGICRMTFYYHFQNIYDLAARTCMEDVAAALQGKTACTDWNEKITQIFEAMLDNKMFILNACRCIGRERLETFLLKATHQLIRELVDEKSTGTHLTEREKDFIACFYQYSFVGGTLDWIRRGMKDDCRTLARDLSLTMQSGIKSAIYNFSTK